jgi:bidirectional [NiFe] hydrogenase diaphorase subunit
MHTESASTPQGVAVVRDNRQKLFERAMARHGFAPDSLIEVLHTAQELYGHLSVELLHDVATKLKLPPSQVLGVATFYNFFSLEPKAEHTVTVCTGTACYVAGAGALVDAVQRRCEHAEARGDERKLALHAARCIGSCGLAPAVILDGRILPRVTKAGLERELDALGLT